MKTYNEYMEEIRNLRTQKRKTLDYPDIPLSERKKWFSDENETEREKYNNKCVEISKENDKIKENNNRIDLKIAILNCNAKIAIFSEIFPKVYEVFNKYNGKPIGEKREQSIRNELKEKYNVTAYIKQGYSSDEINIFELTEKGWKKIGGYELTIVTKTLSKLYKENKLNLPPLEDFKIEYSNIKYTENVDELAEKIIQKHKELLNLKENYKKLREEYNDLLVENMSYINDIEKIYDYPEVKYSN